MQVTPQIDFQGTEPSPAVQEEVSRHLSNLEKRYGRITACRVVLKVPGHHHREGEPYEVNIWLSLPGHGEVSVTRTPREDERHADLTFAINDAFKRARRRLQDRVRRMQGAVKMHEGEPAGVVSELDARGEFGFLSAADGRPIYFHRNSVLEGAFDRLKVGSRVSFVEEEGVKGPQASTVRVLETRRGRHAT